MADDDFFARANAAAEREMQRRAQQTPPHPPPSTRFTTQASSPISPEIKKLLHALDLATTKYAGERNGIERAEKDMAALAAAAPDENGVLGQMSTDDDFED